MLSLERITFYPSLRNCILCYLLLRTKNGIPDVGGNERSGQAKGVPTKTCYQARLFAQADPESFKQQIERGMSHCTPTVVRTARMRQTFLRGRNSCRLYAGE